MSSSTWSAATSRNFHCRSQECGLTGRDVVAECRASKDVECGACAEISSTAPW
jgi:hypothetical protein